MIDFPQTAAFGKRIPFAQLKKQGLAPRFGELIKSLVWAYKLSPDTIQLAATESIRETFSAGPASRSAAAAPNRLIPIKIKKPRS